MSQDPKAQIKALLDDANEYAHSDSYPEMAYAIDALSRAIAVLTAKAFPPQP